MLPPLQRLTDRATDGPDVLTPELAAWYGGPLVLPAPGDGAVVVGNFVQTLDGVAGFRTAGRDPLFGEPNDRMLMSVLRAWSDAVMIGRATLNAGSARATWHWKSTAPKDPPDAHAALTLLEEALGRRRPHTMVIVSAEGADLDFGRAVFHDPDVHAVLLTTAAGGARARASIAAHAAAPRAEVWDDTAADGGIDFAAALARLARSGRPRVLLEGGPTLYGALESRGLVDELFLTVRGLVGGGGPDRLRSFSAHAYAPERLPRLDLESLRSGGDSLLFSRWRYRR